ncbi:sugar phosphate isomerase/epimerase [Pseudonocardia sp. KRD-184]|uniref:Sugar phosphate isomerase/epimerase n=1 Tax=Pseudonocardia oceani TaxID=2792013 RepID=A0ABS6U2M5_9PSEU|nr:TIM barrel protein [Pseudonocardia oceani]MBW0089402.1 sugar phosphate isomerase/epimerase [Pseudonocardia oceani]MBW0096408.1 sugar phosphate isomerase/epimerase [Pseudonocardia oceani]MBW0109142.1 sugar phosphate isomerase/epimerase [Pseudonocardia oceani]MBW0122409.1 sugar phosphate isomerase/epimerase [Pseudonocardia oceani]MBW0126208.1 sugar phosphate isomerase/epimerase [Pseudonocardia oceani]
MLSLAAGTVLDLSPGDAVECAAAAGFPLAGVRIADPRTQARGVAEALRRTGTRLLDVEVVRLAGPLTGAQRGLAETAAGLGARFLLTVSEDPDESATVDRLAELAALMGGRTRVALECMAFTAVRTRAAAERIARAVPGAVVLLDPLHLHRAGDRLDDPADPALTGYAQLCDVADPARVPADLAHEARHDRLPPGRGGLPLAAFVAGLPAGLPLSVEVQSDVLAELDPRDRAVLVRTAAEAVLRPARDDTTGRN